MEVSCKVSMSDDEEDLEALRLVALQSLKKKNELANNSVMQQHFPLGGQGGFLMCRKGLRKRGKFYPNQQGRGARNGQFNSRTRNPNLISITTVDAEENIVSSSAPLCETKLILPQDRYLKCAPKNEGKGEGPTSKFDRFDNSDDESESDEDDDMSSDNSETQESDVKKSDSLEDIMKELEDEISGDQKAKKDTKQLKNKLKLKKSSPDSTAETEETESQKVKIENVVNPDVNVNSIENDTSVKEISVLKEDLIVETNKAINVVETKNDFKAKPKENEKVFKKVPYQKRNNRNFLPKHKISFNHQNLLQSNQLFPNQVAQYPIFQPVMNTAFPPVQPFIMNVPPPHFIPKRLDNPIAPLSLNTENLNDIAMAPLSPRSAAFVLKNRAIIEKRKRSPRRSYSRSPSPRFRHSKSPRRSISPKRSPRRSLSPKRGSLSPRPNSRSPRRLSRSPRRKSLSPSRRYSPAARILSPKKQKLHPVKNSVYNRLGMKLDKADETRKTRGSRSRSRSRSGTPLKDEKTEILDPVLEARRKKFQTNELQIKEGVIRLKQKEDKSVVNEDSLKVESEENFEPTNEKTDDLIEGLSDLNEEELLEEPDDTLDIDPAVEHLLSDLESDSENEGRFKTKSQSNQKAVPVLPFSKLVSGEKPEIKDKLEDSTRSPRNNRNYKYSRKNEEREKTHRRNLPTRARRSPINNHRLSNGRYSPTSSNSRISPVENFNKNESSFKMQLESSKDSETKCKDEKKVSSKFSSKLPITSKVTSMKSDKKPPITTPIENKKIEIKIRNPSKYNKVVDMGNDLIDTELDIAKKSVITCRKVEVKKDEIGSDSESEIIIENEESSDEENSNVNDGDLRAQLSRKRAERQFNKHQPVEGVTSRLLQSALESAVYKKPKKSKKDKEAKRDGRVPIHLRLGIANGSEMFVSKKKKSKKHKSKGSLEQVLSLIAKYFILLV